MNSLSWSIRSIRNFWVRTLLAIAAVAGLLCAVTPSKGTMYAIAVSEMGERAVNSGQVQGIMTDGTKALHAWIKKQLEQRGSGSK